MAASRSFGHLLTALAIMVGGVLISVQPVSAAAYDAALISITHPKTLSPGQVGTVTVTVKNIGTATWQKTGKNFFSLYQWDPIRKVEEPSPLVASNWETDARPLRLPVASLKPGKTVDFTFLLHAPAVPGTYHSDFILASEDLAWIGNSKFSIDLNVGSGAVSVPVSSTPVSQPASPQATVPAPTAPATPTMATGSTDWSAELIGKGGLEWQIDAGDHVILDLAFKNTGTKTWTREGKSFVSIYATLNKKERSSLFKDLSWTTASHANGLIETSVKPGEIGHFKLQLRAPDAPGMYQETFTLAAEDTAWIRGSDLSFPIRVPMYDGFMGTAPPENKTIASSPETISKPTKGIYMAALMLRSKSAITLTGNGSDYLTIGYKNTGTSMWASRSMRIVGVRAATTATAKYSSVRDESWMDSSEPVRVQGSVNPGEMAFLSFRIKAPAKKGTYTASFKLHADGQPVDGGEVDIPITVTADGYIAPEPPAPAYNPPVEAIPLTGDVSTLPAEPNIRVGLFKTTDDRMIVRAKYGPLVVSQNGTTICRVNTGESITVSFDRTNRVYKISGGSCTGQSTGWYLVRAEDNISPMEISDFSRPVGWLPGANDNTFRAQLELRFTPSSNSVWVINELPIEWYLKGIGETSNSSPQEYQRALLTAARTYAVYHVQHATKHANEYYIVDATYDQVYRGYGAESRDPAVVTAVDATRGQIVTYNGKLAITPYYSRSDGRTRAWTEVWGGGPYPWLVSVPVPWDQGRVLWGHGVGMSATGAIGMANDGKRYDEILKHFYTGIELRRVYR